MHVSEILSFPQFLIPVFKSYGFHYKSVRVISLGLYDD